MSQAGVCETNFHGNLLSDTSSLQERMVLLKMNMFQKNHVSLHVK